ncbi:MAG: membrane-bound lytic murein transglycosylase MltF [Pseudomonadota bacterium]
MRPHPIIPALVLCAACSEAPPRLPSALEHGTLVVVTINSPTTVYEDAEGNYAGLEHDLVNAFAGELGLAVRYVFMTDAAQLFKTLEEGRAHLAAAGIPALTPLGARVRFGPTYQTVRFEVVYRTDQPRPRSVADLLGKRLAMVAGSGGAENLRKAATRDAALAWSEMPVEDGLALLARLADGEFDYAVARSNVVAMATDFYPNVGGAFTVGEPTPLAWAFPEEGDPRLLAKAEEFFSRIARDGTLKRLLDRYYGHAGRLGPVDVNGIITRMRSVLPALKPWFQEAERLTGIDWRLLAALGYQESQWDPLATSPTGVRGLMMLTEETADRMGVTDRLDPYQSIIAGARYLLVLKETLPARIPEPDRTWLALAAYNLGFGHLEDGRILAQRKGLDPDAWMDVRQSLPLLSRPDHYMTVQRGFARGGEAVYLVENVRTYYDILKRFEQRERPLTADAPGYAEALP